MRTANSNMQHVYVFNYFFGSVFSMSLVDCLPQGKGLDPVDELKECGPIRSHSLQLKDGMFTHSCNIFTYQKLLFVTFKYRVLLLRVGCRADQIVGYFWKFDTKLLSA